MGRSLCIFLREHARHKNKTPQEEQTHVILTLLINLFAAAAADTHTYCTCIYLLKQDGVMAVFVRFAVLFPGSE